MADKEGNQTYRWYPVLGTDCRTLEFRNIAGDDLEKHIRLQKANEQAIKELADELGVLKQAEKEYELDEDDKKIDPTKRLVETFEYWQAFQEGQDKQGNDTWSVQAVETTVLQDGTVMETPQAISNDNKGLTPLQALGKLAAFEAIALQDKDIYELPGEADGKTVSEAREELGYEHFKAFGEREGLLFDAMDITPYVRQNERVLPLGGRFNKTDREGANKRWKEGRDKIANANIDAQSLLDSVVANAPKTATIDRVLQSFKAVEIMDEFARKIESARENLEIYIGRYTRKNQGEYIENAINALVDKKTGALPTLERLKTERILRDTTEFDRFIKEAHIACYVIHAQAMLDMRSKGAFDDEKERVEVEKSLRALEKDMVKQATTYGLPSDTISKAQNAMALPGGPKMPELLKNYFDHYKQRKKAYEQRRDQGYIPEADTALPPTRKLTVKTPGR